MTSRPTLVLTDANGFAALPAPPGSLVVLQLSRREIEAGLVGDAVDRLLVLTDSDQRARDLAQSLVLEFQGFDADPREVYEIPEIRRFVRALNGQWKDWLHFLVDDATHQQYLLLMALLCDVDVIRNGAAISTAYRDLAQVAHVANGLVNALHHLHKRLGVPASRLDAIVQQYIASTLPAPG
jgi:hypothetical protein